MNGLKFYWIIPFIATVLLTTLNGSIIASEKKDKKKYSLLIFNSALVFWACLDMLLSVNKFSLETGTFLEKLMSVSWLSIGFLFLNFVFQLLNKKPNLIYKLALFTSLLLILISFSTSKIVLSIEYSYWGAFPVFGEWILPVFVLIVSPMIYGMGLIFHQRKRETNINLKKIQLNVIIGVLIAVVVVASIDVILPVIFEIRLISMAAFGNALLSLFLLRVVNKNHLLELSTEEISQSIFDKVNEGVIITSLDGKVLMLNETAKNLTHHNENNLDIILKQSKGEQSVIKTKLVDPVSKESRYINVSSNIITDKVQRQLRLYLLNDVSELVKYRNSLIDKNDEMQITLYRIGHDIKGPASSIKQLVLFCKTDMENSELYLSKIEIAVNQLTNFIKEVEELIRIKEALPGNEDIDLHQIIERCWSELDYYRQQGDHKLELDISNETFKSAPNLIYAMLLNIISNAIKYNDIVGKNISRIKVATVTKADNVEIEVSDNGKGMDEDTINNVYKLFYRGNTQVSGSGLGMYIVKHAIEKLNGTIEIASKPGVGSTFKIIIPVKH